jgi:hypothetical protein
MIKREVFDKVGVFDESLPLWEDRPMWLKITASNIKLQYLDILAAKYRIHANSVEHKVSGAKLYSNFYFQQKRQYYERYINQLPLAERNVYRILIKRLLLLEKYGLNKNNVIIKAYLLLTRLPFAFFIKQIKEKYS